MPIYEYLCGSRKSLTDKYYPNTNAPKTLVCAQCKSDAQRIISGAVYHASEATKTSKLDPRYEKMVDRAMHNSRSADPDRVLRNLKPFPKKK